MSNPCIFFLLQLSDSKAKVLICTPATSSLARAALEAAASDRISAFCLGECSWCPDLVEMAGKVSEGGAPEAYSAEDAEKEMAVVFWSSGTTGTWPCSRGSQKSFTFVEDQTTVDLVTTDRFHKKVFSAIVRYEIAKSLLGRCFVSVSIMFVAN